MSKSANTEHIIATITRMERDLATIKAALLAGGQDWARGPVTVLVEMVAEHYRLPVSAVMGRSRVAPYVFARHTAMYLARTLTKFSLEDIARCFSVDHAAVCNAIKRIQNRIDTDQGATLAPQLDHLATEGKARIDKLRNSFRDLPLFAKS